MRHFEYRKLIALLVTSINYGLSFDFIRHIPKKWALISEGPVKPNLKEG